MSPSSSLVAAILADRPRPQLHVVDDSRSDAAAHGPCDGGCELCSAHFISGAGWAWRVTAALSRGRRADAVAERARSA